jgi:hypothetical protein
MDSKNLLNGMGGSTLNQSDRDSISVSQRLNDVENQVKGIQNNQAQGGAGPNSKYVTFALAAGVGYCIIFGTITFSKLHGLSDRVESMENLKNELEQKINTENILTQQVANITNELEIFKEK